MQAPKLVMSLPLSAYLSAPVTDLNHLSSCLASQSLPGGWVQHVCACQNDSPFFASLTINSPLLSAIATFLVRVDNDMSWTLSYHGVRLEAEQCQALAAIPQRITSVSDVTSLLSIVDASRMCCGNPVEDFKELVDVHRGVLVCSYT